MAAIIQFETEIVIKLICNCKSRLGLTDTHIKETPRHTGQLLKKHSNSITLRNPKGMLELDVQRLSIQIKEILKNWKNNGKTRREPMQTSTGRRRTHLQQGRPPNRMHRTMQTVEIKMKLKR